MSVSDLRVEAATNSDIGVRRVKIKHPDLHVAGEYTIPVGTREEKS
jgi:hypothetical protein